MKKKISFMILLAILFLFLNKALGVSRNGDITKDLYYKEHEEMYELKKNSLDALYIGSSQVYSTISPEDIFHDFGITGYVQASSCQRVWQSYFYLKEALYTQRPKVVLLDAYMILEGSPLMESYNRFAIDPMRMSSVKLEAIRTAVEKNPEEENFLSYIFPILRYHDRWEELSKEDFSFLTGDFEASTKGFMPHFGASGTTFNYEDYVDEEADDIVLDEECAKYLNLIKQECDDNGIELVVVKYPTCLWNKHNYFTVKQWTDLNDVTYLDFNADQELRKQVDINWETETVDGGNHLNYEGAMKVTAWIGNYLSENYDFEDKRENEQYIEWKDDYNVYKKEVTNKKLISINSFADFLETINTNDYLVVTSVGAFNTNQNPKINEMLIKYGLSASFLDSADKANILIKNGNDLVYENANEEVIKYSCKIDGMRIDLKSEVNAEKKTLSCAYENSEKASEVSGVQFIVFDPVTKTYVGTVVWNYNKKDEFVQIR